MNDQNPGYLVHYGIKGQKHGLRRFQNEDGSLTAEGKERYGIGSGNREGFVSRSPKNLSKKQTDAAVKKISKAAKAVIRKKKSDKADDSKKKDNSSKKRVQDALEKVIDLGKNSVKKGFVSDKNGPSDPSDSLRKVSDKARAAIKKKRQEKSDDGKKKDKSSTAKRAQETLEKVIDLGKNSLKKAGGMENEGKPESKTWKSKDASRLSDAELNRRNSRLQREQQYRQMTESKAHKAGKWIARTAGAILVASAIEVVKNKMKDKYGKTFDKYDKKFQKWMGENITSVISKKKNMNIDLSNLHK